MTARVQRFHLKHGENHVAIPLGGLIPYSSPVVLSVGFEPGRWDLSLWTLSTGEPRDEEHRRFLVLETDEVTKADLSRAQFIGTAVSEMRTIVAYGCEERRSDVWHVFELFGGAG